MGSGRHQVVMRGFVAVLAVIVVGHAPTGSVASCAARCSGPRVTTASGEVCGRWVPAERGGARFAAYLGIPYARPPVGQLRYKQPRPAEPWNGTLDATMDPPRCPQVNQQTLVGQEDCLYLNVYVPAELSAVTPPLAPLPVLLLVHGGAYERGSGRLDALGPHFLLNEGVIVASVNYRQGPLGFLGLDTEQVPGNAGLKDIVLAMTWLKANLRAFGGDPDRVTALGYSTGASALHTLSLFPESRELFSRAVLMSGHAITARAYTERHVERANTLATLLGAPDNDTETVTAALKSASVQDLIRANDDPRMRAVGQPLPSPERRPQGEEAKLITQDPESLLRQPKARPMPIILGVSDREGTFPYTIWGLGSRSPDTVDGLLPQFMPADLLPGADTAAMLGLGADPGPGPGPLNRDAALRLARLVRDEYSDGGPIANNTDTLIEFLGDVYTYASTFRAVNFISKAATDAAPLYLYQFQVDDAYNFVKKLYNISFPGASHTDDLGYLVRMDSNPNLNQDLTEQGVAPRTLQRMTKMVADFAKGLQPAGWPAVSGSASSTSSQRPVLFIGPGLRRRVGHPDTLDEHHNVFWTSAYRDLRSKQSSIGRTLIRS